MTQVLPVLSREETARCVPVGDEPGLGALRTERGAVVFAHSDLSGYSVFEEALWWGVAAADGIAG